MRKNQKVEHQGQVGNQTLFWVVFGVLAAGLLLLLSGSVYSPQVQPQAQQADGGVNEENCRRLVPGGVWDPARRGCFKDGQEIAIADVPDFSADDEWADCGLLPSDEPTPVPEGAAVREGPVYEYNPKTKKVEITDYYYIDESGNLRSQYSGEILKPAGKTPVPAEMVPLPTYYPTPIPY